jgi:hypothetical protein
MVFRQESVPQGGVLYEPGYGAPWLTSTNHSALNGCWCGFNFMGTTLRIDATGARKTCGFSIRCIKN